MKQMVWLAVLMLLGWGCRSDDAFRGVEMSDTPLADFVLTDQYGHPFKLSAQAGKVVLFFFGYTFCPDVCPLTLSTWKRVEEALQADAARVKFVYVTVDPERDTPEKLRVHLENFSTDFIGLRGSAQELRPVYQEFGVLVEKVRIADSAAGYLVNHTTRMFVVDQRGYLRVLINHDAPAKEVVHDLRLLLQKKH